MMMAGLVSVGLSLGFVSLGPPQAWSSQRTALAQLTALAPAGNYAVGGGEWPVSAEEPTAQAATSRRQSGRGGKRGGARKSRGSGRGGGRGSPIVSGVLKGMARLDATASLEDVERVLDGKRLRARDYTTVLADLKSRRAWQVALLVGEWLRVQSARTADEATESTMEGATEDGSPSSPPLPNRVHYQLLLTVCAASGKATATHDVAEQMISDGYPLDATAIGTLILAHERAGEWARTADLLSDLLALDMGSATEGAATGSKPKVDPLAFAYASAIRAHEAGGQWEAALGLFEQM